jgi:hypothetical protein
MEKPGQGALPTLWNVTDSVKVKIAVQLKRVAVLAQESSGELPGETESHHT